MAGPGVRVEGARQLRATMRKAGADLDDLKAAHAAVAAFVATRAAAAAPRLTGALGGNVRGNKAAARATVKAGGARVPYAGPIHWGWAARNIPAQPFIAATAQDTEPTWVALYEQGVATAIDQVRGA